MSILRRLLIGCLGCAAAAPARADTTDAIVVQVGATSLRVSDVTRRLAQVPAYQLHAFGDDPGTVRRRFVELVLVPELLHAAEGERRALDHEPSTTARTRDALRRALVDQIRRGIAEKGIPAAEVRGYYDSHESDYKKPERLRLFRILVDDKAAARAILDEVTKPDGFARWNQLARERSVDAATKMRGGALGFVQPDGHTDVPQLAVDPALYAAAARVKDGQYAPEPVREGERWAVVARRGTLPRVERTFEAERTRIEDILIRTRVDQEVSSLVADLRKRELKEEDPAPLESWAPPNAAPSAGPRHGPPPHGSARPVPPRGSADPTPRPTDRGLR